VHHHHLETLGDSSIDNTTGRLHPLLCHEVSVSGDGGGAA
jgi:hypothetical protein